MWLNVNGTWRKADIDANTVGGYTAAQLLAASSSMPTYSNFIETDFSSSVGAGATTILTNVTGKGYLADAFIYMSHMYAGQLKLQIIIDGVTIYNQGGSYSSGTSGWTRGAGFVSDTCIIRPDAEEAKSLLVRYAGKRMWIASHGTSYSAEAFFGGRVINQPIYFNTSLIVRLVNEYTSALTPNQVFVRAAYA